MQGGETVADILQRKVCKYGDNSGKLHLSNGISEYFSLSNLYRQQVLEKEGLCWEEAWKLLCQDLQPYQLASYNVKDNVSD